MNPLGLRYRAVLVVLSVVALSVTVPATAGGNFSISGQVTDGSGAPLERVRIENGTQIAFTDSQGRYRFEFPLPGSYRSYFFRNDLTTESRTASPSVIEPHVTLNLTMYYRVSGSLSGGSGNSLPKTVTVTAVSWAPSDSCVWATEGDNIVQLTFIETLSDTSLKYAGEFTIPAGIALGWHYIDLTAADCASGVTLGTGTITYHYAPTVPPPEPVDTTPPTIDILMPRQGYVSSYDRELAESPDGKTRVLLTVWFKAKVTDNKSLKTVYFELFDASNKLTWNCTPYKWNINEFRCDEFLQFFGSTSYTFRVTATDTAGNLSTLDRSFETNGGPIPRRVVEL